MPARGLLCEYVDPQQIAEVKLLCSTMHSKGALLLGDVLQLFLIASGHIYPLALVSLPLDVPTTSTPQLHFNLPEIRPTQRP